MSKKRAMITVDAEQWEGLQNLLKAQEYPANSMSFYLGACLDHLEANLTGEPEASLSPFHELIIHKKGLKEGLQDIGLTVVPDKSET